MASILRETFPASCSLINLAIHGAVCVTQHTRVTGFWLGSTFSPSTACLVMPSPPAVLGPPCRKACRHAVSSYARWASRPLEAASSTEVWLARVGLDYPPPSAARTELAPSLDDRKRQLGRPASPDHRRPSPVCASSGGPMDGLETDAPRFDLRDGKGFLHPRSTGRLSRMKQVDMQHRLCPTEKPRSSAHSPGCLSRGCPDRMPRRRDVSLSSVPLTIRTDILWPALDVPPSHFRLFVDVAIASTGNALLGCPSRGGGMI